MKQNSTPNSIFSSPLTDNALKRIGIVIGSLRKESLNKKLGELIAQSISTKNAHIKCSVIEIGNLPFFNEDLEAAPLESVNFFRQQILKSDLILFISPEYNRSITGVLKNAVDWGSRPTLKGALYQKPAALIGVTEGRVGTALAQAHLRAILLAVGMKLIQQPEMYLSFSKEAFLPPQNLLQEVLAPFIKAVIDYLK